MPLSFLPKLILNRLTDITPELLGEYGIAALLMDFDNTIVPYTTDVPTREMQDWIARMQRSGVFLAVVSNSREPRVVTFCRQYSLPCVTHARKPFSKGISQALKQFDLRREETALVGDQIYTDVLGANGAGVFSILITPIHLHNIWLRLRNGLEKPFIWAARGRRR